SRSSERGLPGEEADVVRTASAAYLLEKAGGASEKGKGKMGTLELIEKVTSGRSLILGNTTTVEDDEDKDASAAAKKDEAATDTTT
ncbi:unnamed protein product, partial [Amoebophrya sp. A25]